MKLIEFPEQTVIIAKDQPEYLPLPAHRFEHDSTGRIACCWKLTFKERLKVLFGGIVWHEILTFNQPLQPQRLTVDKPEMPVTIRISLTVALVFIFTGCRFPGVDQHEGHNYEPNPWHVPVATNSTNL